MYVCMYVCLYVFCMYVSVCKYACKYVLCMDMIEYMYTYSFIDVCIYHSFTLPFQNPFFYFLLLFVWLLLTFIIKEIRKWEMKESYIIISDLLFSSKNTSKTTELFSKNGRKKSSTEKLSYWIFFIILFVICN